MTGAQLTNCMLASRTADRRLNLENECTSGRSDLEVQDKRNWIPKWQNGAFIGIGDRSDEMLIMTPSENEECSETPRVGALGHRVPHDVEGYAVEPESGGGRDGRRCTFRRYGSTDASTRTSPLRS